MPIIYPKKIREALSSIDIERLKDEIKYFKLNGFIDDNNNLILPWMK